MKVHAFGPTVRGLDEDNMLCPFRALKIYKARTNSIRKQNPQMRRLFISYMKGFSKDICKNTLVGWIRSLINSVRQMLTLSYPAICCKAARGESYVNLIGLESQHWTPKTSSQQHVNQVKQLEWTLPLLNLHNSTG